MKLRHLLLIVLFWLLSLTTCLGATGTASWYGEEHRGHIMANGRPFNPDKLTCASWHYSFGTKLKVIHGAKSVIVEVTDRGPAKRLHRIVDLSAAAFKQLDDPDLGLIAVTIVKLNETP